MLAGRGEDQGLGSSSYSTTLPSHRSRPSPNPLPQVPQQGRTSPSLTFVHPFLSCRYILEDSRVVGVREGQTPPSPAWYGGEELEVKMYKPGALGGLRLSVQGPAAGEQVWFQISFLSAILMALPPPRCSSNPSEPHPVPSSICAYSVPPALALPTHKSLFQFHICPYCLSPATTAHPLSLLPPRAILTSTHPSSLLRSLWS